MKTISKILSVVLCLTMVLGLFVVGASATGPNPSATEADFNTFPQSVEVNQQRLMTNAYYPLELEDIEGIYRACY